MTAPPPARPAPTPEGASDGWIENRPSQGRRAIRFDEIWAYRELVGFLALRDVKVRYKQAVFGGLWAIVQPLLAAVIFTVVFSRLAKVSSGDVPYLVLAFANFSLWSYFSTSLNTARTSLVANSSLITKVYFPRLVAPLAAVFPGLLDLGVALVVLGAMAAWGGVGLGAELLLAPAFLLGAMVVAFGTGALFSALTVQYRDVHEVFGLLTQLWLFASPVAYPATLVEGAWRWPYHLNPMVGVLEGWRWTLLDGPAPGRPALLSAAVAVAVLVVGLRVFRRSESRFADVI
jgi:lipopolysaccharide transport system permease protein